MTRFVVTVLATLLLASASSVQAGAPELFAKAAVVKLYMFEGDEKKETGVLTEFRTRNPTAVPAAGATLNAKQMARVKQAFTHPTGDQALGACFVPRHGFVFEDAQGKVIGTLDVCFECTNYAIDAPGYREKVKPVYDRFAQKGDWNAKLAKKQTKEVDRLRATFDMPPTKAPVDWKALAALVTELGMPTAPKPADYDRLRAAAK